MMRTVSAIWRDEQGATLVEFAFVAPIFLVLLLGIFDAAYTQYSASMVNGVMQKAGRDMTLENAGGNQATLDAMVEDRVQRVVPGATVALSKLSHFDFDDIGEAEDFTDEDGDGICNNNEIYVDDNANGQWDADKGKSGIGGARDAVLYTATVTYPRIFPMYTLIGLPETVTVSASTVLRNQPYDNQDRSTTTGNCA